MHRWLRFAPSLVLAPVLVLSVSITPVAATAPVKCDASTNSDWLRQPIKSLTGARIETSRVQAVRQNISAASAMLENRHFVVLSKRDLVKFVGTTAMPQPTGSYVRPYLVRAVFPTPSPHLEVRWSGGNLHVFSAGLGCAPFTKHPIVLFLDRKPANVYVVASAAL